MWPGWALRLMPPGDYDFLRYRAALAIMLAIAVTGAEDYRTAQELLGLEPFHSSRLATGSYPSPASPASATQPASLASGPILTSQVRQLEAAVGTTLLRTGPGGTITLTTDGEQFARDVAPVLDMLAATGH